MSEYTPKSFMEAHPALRTELLTIALRNLKVPEAQGPQTIEAIEAQWTRCPIDPKLSYCLNTRYAIRVTLHTVHLQGQQDKNQPVRDRLLRRHLRTISHAGIPAEEQLRRLSHTHDTVAPRHEVQEEGTQV